MSCGVGHRYGLDPALLWLWRRLSTTVPIRPLAWEPPCAEEEAQEMAKRQKKKKKKEEEEKNFTFDNMLLLVHVFSKWWYLQLRAILSLL